MSSEKEVSNLSISSDLDKYLEFTLGDENYVMPLLKVREVIAVPKTTPIPHAPKHFVGIMNLRGQVISILDLRTQLNIQTEDNSNEKAVIIIDFAPTYIGIVVDSVNTVVSVPESDLSDPPDMNSSEGKKCIRGIYRKKDEMALVIDVGAALGVEDLNLIKKNSNVA